MVQLKGEFALAAKRRIFQPEPALEVDVLIHVRNLQKSYGDKIALHGISFDVNEGEVFGFSAKRRGKTTTLKILTDRCRQALEKQP